MSILTDEELLALRNYAGEILPREVEKAVLVKLAAGVSVEPFAYTDQLFVSVRQLGGFFTASNDKVGMFTVPLYTADALAAARVQENERCAKRLEMFASLMDEAAKLIEQIPPEVMEALDGYRWPLCDELGGAATIAKDEIRALLGKEAQS